MHSFFSLTLNTFIILLEFAGAVIISFSAFIIFIRFFHLKFNDPSTDIRLRFARSIALGLEFLLSGEIIRTVTTRNGDELLIVIALVILRGLMTLLIHWEIDHDIRLTQLE